MLALWWAAGCTVDIPFACLFSVISDKQRFVRKSVVEAMVRLILRAVVRSKCTVNENASVFPRRLLSQATFRPCSALNYSSCLSGVFWMTVCVLYRIQVMLSANMSVVRKTVIIRWEHHISMLFSLVLNTFQSFSSFVFWGISPNTNEVSPPSQGWLRQVDLRTDKVPLEHSNSSRMLAACLRIWFCSKHPCGLDRN